MDNNDLQPWERELLASEEGTPVRDVTLDETRAPGNVHFYGFEDDECQCSGSQGGCLHCGGDNSWCPAHYPAPQHTA
jgi:hypothetical protein